jgi:hypothetical protein
VDDGIGAAETALDVIGEPEPAPADRMKELVGCGDNGGARHTGQEILQTGKGGRGIP